MIAGYIRVSSRSQDYATQRSALERAAAARGDAIAHWFEEKRRRKASHPELDELVARVHAGDVRRVYVFRLDRFTSGMRRMLTIVDSLHSRGCAIVSLGDPWFDLTGPFGELILAIMGWAAEQETAALGERIAAARTRVEAEGGTWGRPPACDLATVKKIDALAAEGKSERVIAQTVRVKRATVHSVLVRNGPYASIPRESQIRLVRRVNPPAVK